MLENLTKIINKVKKNSNILLFVLIFLYTAYLLAVNMANEKYFGILIIAFIAFWLFTFLKPKAALYLLIILIPFGYVIKLLMAQLNFPFANIFGAYKDIMLIFILSSVIARILSESRYTFRTSKLHLPIILFMAALIFPFVVTIYSEGLVLAILGLRRTVEYLFFFFIVIFVLKDMKDIKNFSTCLLILGFLICFGGILQLLFFSGTLMRTYLAQINSLLAVVAMRPTSILHGPPEFGTLSAYFCGLFLGLSCFLNKGIKGKLIVSALLIIMAVLVLSFTRSAWGSFILAVIIWSVLKPRYIAKQTGLLVVIGALIFIILIQNPFITYRFTQIFDPEEGSRKSRVLDLTERYAITKVTEIVPILFGNGFSYGLRPKFLMKSDKESMTSTKYIHNFYLQLYWETGLFGFACFIWMLFAYLKLLLTTENKLKDLYLKGLANGLFIACLVYCISLVFTPITSVMGSIFFSFAGITVLLNRIAISRENKPEWGAGIPE